MMYAVDEIDENSWKRKESAQTDAAMVEILLYLPMTSIAIVPIQPETDELTKSSRRQLRMDRDGMKGTHGI